MFIVVDYCKIAFELSEISFPPRRGGKGILVADGHVNLFIASPSQKVREPLINHDPAPPNHLKVKQLCFQANTLPASK